MYLFWLNLIVVGQETNVRLCIFKKTEVRMGPCQFVPLGLYKIQATNKMMETFYCNTKFGIVCIVLQHMTSQVLRTDNKQVNSA